MAVAIPAAVAAVAEAAPTILSAISLLSAAKQAAPSLNSLFSSGIKKKAKSFFKSLTSPKGIFDAAVSGVKSIASGEAIDKALSIAQGASTLISALETGGFTNDQSKSINSLLNKTIDRGQAINSQIKSNPVAKVVANIKHETVTETPSQSISEDIPEISKPKKKKSTKNNLNTTTNGRTRTYR